MKVNQKQKSGTISTSSHDTLPEKRQGLKKGLTSNIISIPMIIDESASSNRSSVNKNQETPLLVIKKYGYTTSVGTSQHKRAKKN